jgi:hypothetical protein
VGGALINRLSGGVQRMGPDGATVFRGGELVPPLASPADLAALVTSYREDRGVETCLGIAIFPGPEKQDVHLALTSPDGQQSLTRPYGGPPEYAPRWAVNHGLDLLRKL